LLVFSLNFAALSILFSLENQFEVITNVPVYDTQNDLTSDRLLAQLPLYTGDARNAYLRFSAFDFVFPLVADIFLAVVWALLLRLNTWTIAQKLLVQNLPLFPLSVTLWDCLENLSLLAVLNAGTPPNQMWINAALFFKWLKLTWLTVNGAVTAVLLLMLVLNLIYRLLKQRQRSLLG